MHENAKEDAVAVVNRVTMIPRKEFPFTYLGVPIYYSRRKSAYYKEITDKVTNYFPGPEALICWGEDHTH